MKLKCKSKYVGFLLLALLSVLVTSYCLKGAKTSISKYAASIGDENLKGLANRIEGVNRDIQEKGIVFDFLSGKHVLTGYSHGQVFDWDIYFECIYQMYNGKAQYCFDNMEAFLLRQREDGFIRRSFGPNKNTGKLHMFKPFIAQTVLLGMRQHEDVKWLERNYDKIVKYENCWYEKYDKDKNGLCVWYNADHSGMDNQGTRVINGLIDEGVDLNCYLYREFCALSELAKTIGKEQDAKEFTVRAKRIKDVINTLLWDEETGFYYDRLETTGKLNKVKGISGFAPLYAGIVSKERAERLVKEHLMNEKEFWAEYPINTLAQDEPGYEQKGTQVPGWCNWNGTTWIPFNYMVFHGLLHYGYNDVAKELANRTFDLVYKQNPVTREYYDADTGEGYGRNPFFGWSTLAYFMPLEYALKYDPTNIKEEKMLPLALKLLDHAQRKQ